jgi:TP901 family phage tail tape measure protein
LTTTAVTLVVKTLGTNKLDRLDKSLRGVDNNYQKVAGSSAKAENGIRKTGKASAVAAKGVGALSLAFKQLLPALGAAAFVGKFFQGFGEADNARAKVASLGVDVDALERRLRRVASESGNLASTTQLLGASYDVASAGFGNAADNAKILEASLKGAVGGISEIGIVSDAVTSVLNAYGKSADEAGKLIDGFIQTQNDGKIVVDQYASQIGRLAPIGAAAGVGIEELNAAISAITAQGVPIEATFAGLRQGIASILKPSDEAQKLAAKLGIEFNAAALEAKGFGGVLADVQQKTGGSTEKLTQLFGSVEALTALLPLTNDNLEQYNKNLDNQTEKSGQADDATKKLGGTVTSQITKIINGIGDLARSLDKVLGPALQAILQKVNDIINRFTTLISLINDKNIGTATQDIFKGNLAISAGADLQGIDNLRSAIKNLDPAFVKSEETAKQYEDTLNRVSTALARVTQKGANNLAPDVLSGATALSNVLDDLRGQLRDVRAKGFTSPDPVVSAKDAGIKVGDIVGGDDDNGNAAKATKERVRSIQDLLGFDWDQALGLEEAKRQLFLTQQQTDALAEGNTELYKQLEAAREYVRPLLEIEALENAIVKTQKKLTEFAGDEVATLKLKNQLTEFQNRLLERQATIEDKRAREQNKSLSDDLKAAQAFGEKVQGVKALNKELTAGEQLLNSAYTTVTNNLTSGIQGVIEGTQKWSDILSDILGQLGQLALQFAFKSLGTAIGVSGFANGGRPQPNKLSIVGERGPELFVPDTTGTVIPNDAFAESAAALLSRSDGPDASSDGDVIADADDAFRSNGEALEVSKYFSQNSQSISNNASYMRQMSESQSQQIAMNTMLEDTIRVQVDTVNVGGLDVVTTEQFAEGMQKTAKQARAQVFSDMKNKPSVRRKVGM